MEGWVSCSRTDPWKCGEIGSEKRRSTCVANLDKEVKQVAQKKAKKKAPKKDMKPVVTGKKKKK